MGFFERLQMVLAAIAFAEEGEAETARRLAAEPEEQPEPGRDRGGDATRRDPPPHLRALSERRHG